MSSEKAIVGASSRPAFEPYPSQSMPDSMDNSGAGRKKSRRPSETAPVLCQHCGKVSLSTPASSFGIYRLVLNFNYRTTNINNVSSNICNEISEPALTQFSFVLRTDLGLDGNIHRIGARYRILSLYRNIKRYSYSRLPAFCASSVAAQI